MLYMKDSEYDMWITDVAGVSVSNWVLRPFWRKGRNWLFLSLLDMNNLK